MQVDAALFKDSQFLKVDHYHSAGKEMRKLGFEQQKK